MFRRRYLDQPGLCLHSGQSGLRRSADREIPRRPAGRRDHRNAGYRLRRGGPASARRVPCAALLREAVADAHRSAGCIVYHTSDVATDIFHARMDTLAEEKFRAPGLQFPATMEERGAASLPVYADLATEGLIIDEQDGDIERFPSAFEE